MQIFFIVTGFLIVLAVIALILWLLVKSTEFQEELGRVKDFLMRADRNSIQRAEEGTRFLERLEKLVYDSKSKHEAYEMLQLWNSKFAHLYPSNHK